MGKIFYNSLQMLQCFAPLDKHSIPNEPVPEKMSNISDFSNLY